MTIPIGKTNKMKTLTTKQQKLVAEHTAYAEDLALALGQRLMRDMSELCIDMDDLKQESLLGLCEAAAQYRSGTHAEFRTLAYWWCRKYVLQAVRKYGVPVTVPDDFEGEVAVVRLDLSPADREGVVATDDDDADEYPLLSQLSADSMHERERREACQHLVQMALRQLTPRQQEVLCCLYGLDRTPMSQSDTARLLGLSSTRISQIERRALSKLLFRNPQ